MKGRLSFWYQRRLFHVYRLGTNFCKKLEQFYANRPQRSPATFGYELALARPEIFPEMPVIVSGFKPEIDETPWLVKKAPHTIHADSGFSTSLDMEMRDDPTTDAAHIFGKEGSEHATHYMTLRLFLGAFQMPTKE